MNDKINLLEEIAYHHINYGIFEEGLDIPPESASCRITKVNRISSKFTSIFDFANQFVYNGK